MQGFINFILILCLFVFNFSCDHSIESKSPEFKQDRAKLSKAIATCFGQIDFSMNRPAIGCAAGYYVLASSEYVLHIGSAIHDIFNQGNFSCTQLQVKGNEISCQLWLFEKEKAHLGNICTDVILVDQPKPIQKLNAVNGTLKVIFTPKDRNAFIKIDKLIFEDSNHQPLRLEDIILWDVKNIGISG